MHSPVGMKKRIESFYGRMFKIAVNFSFLLFIFSGCNILIGLDKKDLPRKSQTKCTKNEDCNDGHGCTEDRCILSEGSCVNLLMSEGTPCREKKSENVCDIETEYCNGIDLDCPPDSFEPSTFECRATAGQCDEPEYCTGDLPTCPPDIFSGADKVCDDGDSCTYDDRCDGEGGCRGINGIIGADSISIGPWGFSSCILIPPNIVKCWGNNVYGQLGDGTENHKFIPVNVVNLPQATEVLQLSCGGRHACAILATKKIMCWGLGDTGQLGNGRSGTDYESHVPVEVTGISQGWKNVAGGYLFTCGIQDDGSAYCWGKNDFGQLGIGTNTEFVSTPTKVAAGDGLDKVSIIAGGVYHTCAVDLSGALWCWGRNEHGQIGIDPLVMDKSFEPKLVHGLPEGTRVIDFAPGATHTCALLEDGRVMCWGDNAFGELGVGVEHPETYEPVEVTGFPSVVKDIVSGFQHTCAVLEDGCAMCWGNNEDGQIGDGNSGVGLKVGRPVQVLGLPGKVTQIAVGAYNTCAILEDKTVWCWGDNMFGQIGDGSKNPSPVPVQVHCECPFPNPAECEASN